MRRPFRTIGSLGLLTLPALGCSSAPARREVVLDEWTITEQLDRDWGEQWVSRTMALPPGIIAPWQIAVRGTQERAPGLSRWSVEAAKDQPDDNIAGLLVAACVHLRPGETRRLRIVRADASDMGARTVSPSELFRRFNYCEPGICYDFADVEFWSGSKTLDPALPVDQIPAPIRRILSAKPHLGAARVDWHLSGLPPVRRISAVELPRTSLIDWREATYEFADGRKYVCRYGTMQGEPAVVVQEDFRELDGGELTLDLSHTAGLTHGHGRGRLAPPSTGKLTKGYAIDFSREWTGRIQPFYAWWRDYGLWWAAYNPAGGYVGILPLKPSEWNNPAPNVIRVRTAPGGRVQAIMPLHKGTRTWAIVLSTAEEALKESSGGANLMMRQAIRMGQNPLEKVKDMVLTWPGMDQIEYPHLLCKPADLSGIREKARTHPLYKRVLEQHPEMPEDPAGLYLATGDESIARQGIDELIERLKKWVEETLDGGNYGESLCAIPFTRPLRSAAMAFDALAASPSMTSAERNYCLRTFAFLAYCLYDKDRWPDRAQGFHRGNVNFQSDDYTCRAAVVALLKGHPKQNEWMGYVEREMRREFDDCVSPGGAWCEAPNYQAFTMHYLIIAMRLMQLNGFADLSGEPRFRDTLDYTFRLQTPFDARAGCHMLPTVGDTTSSYHSQSLQNIFAWSAALLRDRDPAFAGRMMRAWERGGSVLFGKHGLGFGQGWLQPLLLIDPDIPAIAPPEPMTSQRLPGYGAILRNSYGTDRESYFLFKMGPISQHFDSDEGSFHWYALGRPVSLDFGSMYEPSIEQPWLHSTLDFERRRTWSQGEIQQFTSLPEVDFCSGRIQVKHLQRVSDLPEQPLPTGVSGEIEWNRYDIRWQREVLFVKGPDYVILRDDLDDAADRMPTGWTVQALASEAQANGPLALCKGQHGVDLAVLLAEPPGVALSSSRWGYEGEPAPSWVAPNPMPAVAETQIALHATAAPDQGYLAVLAPHRSQDPPPGLARPHPGVLSIRHAAGEDLVFIGSNRARQSVGDMVFDGRVGAVFRQGPTTTVCIIDGKSIEIPGLALQCESPVSLRVENNRLTGMTDGPAGRIVVRRPGWSSDHLRAEIDGRGIRVESPETGTIAIAIPAGSHRFAIRTGTGE